MDVAAASGKIAELYREFSLTVNERTSMPIFDLKDKICLITGAGRGLGYEIAWALSEASATVVGCDLREERLFQLENDLSSNGGKVLSILADVSDEQQAKDCVDNVVEQYGRLDVLINNAAIDMTVPVSELSVEDWDNIIAVNLRGPFLMSKFAFEGMKKKGAGQIINIVSTASKRTWANASAYHASKWGLLGFSHALHVEGRPYNIKVTALVSGGMRTPFLTERFPDIDLSTLQDPKSVARAVRFVIEQPEETVIPEMMVLPMKETSWP